MPQNSEPLLFRQPENLKNASKREFRRILRQARKKQPENARRQAEHRANCALKRLLKRGSRIGLYWAVGSELKLDELVQTAHRRGAQVYLPYIEPRSLRLWFTSYPSNGSAKAERHRGGSKIRIPQFGGRKIRADRLHTLVLPIVGIDCTGLRLGQGGGYYDCTLAACRTRKPRTVATGFACQSVAALPTQPHDIRVQQFASECGIYTFSRFQAA